MVDWHIISSASVDILNYIQYIEFRLIYVIENWNQSKLISVRDLVSSSSCTACLLMFLAQELDCEWCDKVRGGDWETFKYQWGGSFPSIIGWKVIAVSELINERNAYFIHTSAYYQYKLLVASLKTYSIGSLALNQMSRYEIFSAGAFPAGVQPCHAAIQLLRAVLTACGWALSGEGDVDKPSWRDYKPISYLLLSLALTYYKPPWGCGISYRKVASWNAQYLISSTMIKGLYMFYVPALLVEFIWHNLFKRLFYHFDLLTLLSMTRNKAVVWHHQVSSQVPSQDSDIELSHSAPLVTISSFPVILLCFFLSYPALFPSALVISHPLLLSCLVIQKGFIWTQKRWWHKTKKTHEMFQVISKPPSQTGSAIHHIPSTQLAQAADALVQPRKHVPFVWSLTTDCVYSLSLTSIWFLHLWRELVFFQTCWVFVV